MTAGSDPCNKCSCLRTDNLIVWSDNLRDVPQRVAFNNMNQTSISGILFLLFYMYLPIFRFFFVFCHLLCDSSCSLVWWVLTKGPQSYVHVRIDTSILATYTCDCVYAYNADLDHTMALPLIPTAKGLQAPIHDHKPAQTECHDVIKSDSRYPSQNDYLGSHDGVYVSVDCHNDTFPSKSHPSGKRPYCKQDLRFGVLTVDWKMIVSGP